MSSSYLNGHMARIISAAVCGFEVGSYTNSVVKCKLRNAGNGIEIWV